VSSWISVLIFAGTKAPVSFFETLLIWLNHMWHLCQPKIISWSFIDMLCSKIILNIRNSCFWSLQCWRVDLLIYSLYWVPSPSLPVLVSLINNFWSSSWKIWSYCSSTTTKFICWSFHWKIRRHCWSTDNQVSLTEKEVDIDMLGSGSMGGCMAVVHMKSMNELYM